MRVRLAARNVLRTVSFARSPWPCARNQVFLAKRSRVPFRQARRFGIVGAAPDEELDFSSLLPNPAFPRLYPGPKTPLGVWRRLTADSSGSPTRPSGTVFGEVALLASPPRLVLRCSSASGPVHHPVRSQHNRDPRAPVALGPRTFRRLDRSAMTNAALRSVAAKSNFTR